MKPEIIFRSPDKSGTHRVVTPDLVLIMSALGSFLYDTGLSFNIRSDRFVFSATLMSLFASTIWISTVHAVP
jgi:hypothetical protein